MISQRNFSLKMNPELEISLNNKAGTPVKPVNAANEKPDVPVDQEYYPRCPVGWGQTCTIA